MLPTMEIEDRHIVQLLKIKGQVADTNVNYKKILQESIENLIKQRTIRDLASRATGAK